MKATYELYVRDPNGWEDSCPDFESVFFNGGPSDLYIHPVDGGHEHAGSLLVSGYRRAKAKLADLSNSGDWETYVDDYSDEQIVKRPIYGMRKPSGEILIEASGDEPRHHQRGGLHPRRNIFPAERRAAWQEWKRAREAAYLAWAASYFGDPDGMTDSRHKCITRSKQTER